MRTGSRFSYRKKCNYNYDILHLFRRSEEQVYAAAMAWVKHNIAERRQHLPVVLQHVRMPLLSPKFLVCFIFIPVNLNFINFEKATLLLYYVVPVKSKVKISQNFVAFSEYMNFTYFDFGPLDLRPLLMTPFKIFLLLSTSMFFIISIKT